MGSQARSVQLALAGQFQHLPLLLVGVPPGKAGTGSAVSRSSGGAAIQAAFPDLRRSALSPRATLLVQGTSLDSEV